MADADSGDAPWPCPRCGDQWPYRARGSERFVPYGETARVEGCRTCLIRDHIQPRVRAERLAAYGLDQGRAAQMTLDNFQPLTAREEAAQRAALAVADQWRAGGPQSIWFWSPLQVPPVTRKIKGGAYQITGCGCGKTHLAYALARVAIGLNRSVKLVAEGELLKSLRDSYGDEAGVRSESVILSEHNSAYLLVIDDLGTANVKSVDWYQDVFYGLVNARYLARRPIVLTSNLLPADFAARLGIRTMSRLGEMGVGFYLDGPDRRQFAAEELNP